MAETSVSLLLSPFNLIFQTWHKNLRACRKLSRVNPTQTCNILCNPGLENATRGKWLGKI